MTPAPDKGFFIARKGKRKMQVQDCTIRRSAAHQAAERQRTTTIVLIPAAPERSPPNGRERRLSIKPDDLPHHGLSFATMADKSNFTAWSKSNGNN